MDLGSFPLDYRPYHQQSDSQVFVNGILSLNGFGGLVRPLVQSVLYPRLNSPEAIPKYISRSTSYLQVWLAFHPYPHVIPFLFNESGFGPPVSFTSPSSCTRIDHLVSCLLPLTCRPIQTRFPFGFAYRLNLASNNNSLTHYAKGTQSHTFMCSYHL